MYAKSVWVALLLLAILAVSGCPRNPKGDTTIVTPPAGGDTTIVNKTDTTTTTPPATNPDGTTTPPATNPDGTPATPPESTPAEPPKEGEVTSPPKEGEVTGGTTVVVLETTKGNIEITLHEDWAPNGVKHFLELCNEHYYDGAPWFRVIPGFMAQTGMSGDPEMTKKWGEQTIPADPVVKGNKRGFVSYGQSASGPDSRSTHFFINFTDNSFLDGQGFAAFGEVTAGMDVVDKLFPIPDQALGQSGLNQGSLATAEGLKMFKEKFPDADFINKAYVK